jgi:O-methyltransferase involved in polyketide biosynthesis
VESFGAGFFDSDYLAGRREQMRRLREEAGGDDGTGPDVQDLWFIEERADVADWLMERGWVVTAVEAADLMQRFGRCGSANADDTTPRTVFVEGRLA